MIKILALLGSFYVIHTYCESHASLDFLPRGVHPDLAPFYADGSTFQCMDGSKSVPFSQINDDFCDCQDGSDEPGTAACSSGKFYCANQGHAAKVLGSTRVNDGICDCCDGSDEWAMEDNSCVDKCAEMGEQARLEAAKAAAVQEEGYLVRQSLTREGKEMKAQKTAEIEKLQKELDLAQELQLDKEEVKLTAEGLEKEALDRHREAQQKQREEREAAEKLEDDRRAMEVFRSLDVDHDGKIDEKEVVASALFDQDKDGVVSEEEAHFFLSGAQEYNQEDFLSTGWHLLKPRLTQADDSNVSSQETIPETEKLPEEQNAEGTEGLGEEEAEEEEEKDEDHLNNDVGRVPDAVDHHYDEETQRLVDEAEKARSEFEAVRSEVRSLEDKISSLKKWVDREYGPEDEYAAFAERCVEMTDPEYTYQICLFDYCSQKPKSGGSETKLGNWEKWEGGHSTMVFSGGQQCWNGPSRSTKVHVKCAAETKLVSVTEPSKCEYEMVLEIPSACSNPKAERVHDEL